MADELSLTKPSITPTIGIAKRELHFIWMCDCSGSMGGAKIQSLNDAIRNSIPEMQKAAAQNPHVAVKVRVVQFGINNGATWHVAAPTPVENFVWKDLGADGLTPMGKALRLVAEELDVSKMSNRAIPPVIVLISDGYPTDEFESGLNALMAKPWGKKAVRIAIGIEDGNDKPDYESLEKFVGNKEIKVLEATNAESLLQFVRWASSGVLSAASQVRVGDGEHVDIPAPPAGSDSEQVWTVF